MKDGLLSSKCPSIMCSDRAAHAVDQSDDCEQLSLFAGLIPLQPKTCSDSITLHTTRSSLISNVKSVRLDVAISTNKNPILRYFHSQKIGSTRNHVLIDCFN